MSIVSTMGTTKDDRIYVRIASDIKNEFELVAKYKGLKPSALLHSLIVQKINEMKREAPEVFVAVPVLDKKEMMKE